MKNNLILFPSPRQRHEPKAEMLEPSDQLKALRAAFDRARIGWPLEEAELPENNKMHCGSKK
ncbi:hypothetical protein MUS1_08450 [Marinomonas ushuaiensis DSM 15871]|uniref:Uncharacterized protein n=1 Tax=Marinomonas ushuaiensis DSM 15871 TaxID=1122207 RepID=X7E2Y0_9GAMM|nr:hypothetical protein [Marinomonas ushuaiensis]ETX09533.1 hypothetical protein MUS1_08450 [Marinomonas ushuaiensis DSM 15871]